MKKTKRILKKGISRSTASVPQTSGSVQSLREILMVAQIRSEKCELKEARESYTQALEIAKEQSDLRNMMEALAGLLRLAGEAQDEAAVRRLETELDAMMKRYPKQVPPMAWYCKGVIARHQNDAKLAQRHLHRYLRTVRREKNWESDDSLSNTARVLTREEAIVRGWVMLAIVLWQRNRLKRSLFLVDRLLHRFETKSLRGVNGMLYHLRGSIYEKQRDYAESLKWFQKAHVAFMAEHSWYYHLYVLYAYARLARKQQNYSQAYWYLDLIDKAVTRPEFGMLRQEIAREKSRLEQDAVDLLIDSRQCIVTTREGGQISLRKQYVLLNILEALSNAHRRSDVDRERGLSKAEIIERVWKENYRPEAHDNKLYYNINRLRKLIEPDVHKPQYLLNWREGYRLAPGLRIQFVGSLASDRDDERAEAPNA